jgi:hypothetical protein
MELAMHKSSGLDQAMIDAIVDQLDLHGLDPDLLSEFRQSYSGVHFTYCMDDDVSVNAKPLISRPHYNIYLVNSSQHCSVLSNDLEAASGMVIAEVIAD